MKREITVAMVVKNVESDIERIIKRLLNQVNYPKEKYEILVIDTGSSDNTIPILKRYQNLVRIIETRVSVGKARYLALKHARGDIVAYVDGDAIPPKNFLSRISKNFRRDKLTVAVIWKSKTYPDKGFFYRCMAALFKCAGDQKNVGSH